MTGYGRAKFENENREVTVELCSPRMVRVQYSDGAGEYRPDDPEYYMVQKELFGAVAHTVEDLGSALILVPVGGCIVFVAGIRWRMLSIICLTAVAVMLLALLNEFCPRRLIDPETGESSIAYAGIAPQLKDYQRDRLLIFLDPERDITGRGYNSHQARLAVGSGGWTGKGIGQGTQNLLGFLPYSISNNDFIFSVIAEETGFLGCLVLFATYMVLFYTILRTGITASDPFGRYLCVGVGVMLFTHFFINVGMCIGLAPITGLPLPFVSYGGSFVLTGMSALGLVQSVYRHREDEEE